MDKKPHFKAIIPNKSKNSEEKFKSFFNNASEIMLVVDAKGDILEVNDTAVKRYGYTREEFLKMKINELDAPDIPTGLRKNIKTTEEKGYSIFERVHFRKDGTKVPVEVSCSPIVYSGQKAVFAIVRDISERKKAERLVSEIKNRDEAILYSIGDAVFATDKDGKILLFNKMAEEMTGISSKIAIGSHYSQIIIFIKESDGKPSNDFILEAVKNNTITKMRNHSLLLRKDGSRIPVADSAAPIKNIEGDIIGCVVVFHDVTKERQIDKVKTEFVSLASHQLRNPLSTINWYSEMLLSEKIGKLTQIQREHVQEVYRASQRMVSLVDDLLTVSRLELGTLVLELKLVNIVEIVETCLKELNPEILKKKLVVKQKYDQGVFLIKADPKLLSIIFQNFLSNSVKYTQSGGNISLTIAKEKDRLQIEISDTGIGIPKNHQKEIFTKFFRADNAKKIYTDGTGLGLYIVKEIIDQTGGKIWFESQEGKGTSFYITFPLLGMVQK